MNFQASSHIDENLLGTIAANTEPVRPHTAMCAGSLLGDLKAVATTLSRVLPYHSITVWMNADAEILYSSNAVPDVFTSWIAGTYDLNATPQDIESDLLSLKRERLAVGILDD